MSDERVGNEVVVFPVTPDGAIRLGKPGHKLAGASQVPDEGRGIFRCDSPGEIGAFMQLPFEFVRHTGNMEEDKAPGERRFKNQSGC